MVVYEYYSVITNNELLMHAGTQINLINIGLNERSQTQRVHMYDSIHRKTKKR